MARGQGQVWPNLDLNIFPIIPGSRPAPLHDFSVAHVRVRADAMTHLEVEYEIHVPLLQPDLAGTVPSNETELPLVGPPPVET